MCPFKPCTAEMMASGDCLTFIQAVAIQVHASAGSSGHMVIMRNNSLRVDYEDRKAETNLTFGPRAEPAMTITASGTGSATAPQVSFTLTLSLSLSLTLTLNPNPNPNPNANEGRSSC